MGRICRRGVGLRKMNSSCLLVSTLRDAQTGDVYIYADDERHTVSRKRPQYTNMTLVDGKKRVVRTGDIESSGFRRFTP